MATLFLHAQLHSRFLNLFKDRLGVFNVKCLCGSDKLAKNCHGESISEKKLRMIIENHVEGANQVGLYFSPEIKPTNFGKRKKTKIKCNLIYTISMTPAGVLVYPISLIKDGKAIRPITIDGNSKNNNFFSIDCMLTPQIQGHIDVKDDSGTRMFSRGCFIKCDCTLECFGNPFESLFALDYKDQKIKLFHHTTKENSKLIKESSKLLGSKWNLQGIQQLEHLNYIYFTDLKEVNTAFDLTRIGMSDKGHKVGIRTDDNMNWEEVIVYHESAKNRDGRISVWVDPTIIVPPHIILHEPISIDNGYGVLLHSWWEVYLPSIFRVPVNLGSYLPITMIGDDEYILEKNENLLSVGGFNAGYGMDIASMKRIIKDSTYSTPVIDSVWYEVWSGKNFDDSHEELLKSIALFKKNRNI